MKILLTLLILSYLSNSSAFAKSSFDLALKKCSTEQELEIKSVKEVKELPPDEKALLSVCMNNKGFKVDWDQTPLKNSKTATENTNN